MIDPDKFFFHLKDHLLNYKYIFVWNVPKFRIRIFLNPSKFTYKMSLVGLVIVGKTFKRMVETPSSA